MRKAYGINGACVFTGRPCIPLFPGSYLGRQGGTERLASCFSLGRLNLFSMRHQDRSHVGVMCGSRAG